MDKLLYVGCRYQEKTRSTDYIEGAPQDETARKGRGRYSAVVFFQVNPAYYLNFFRGQNIVFIPMYDAFPVSKRRHLLFLRRIKWLCFTEKYRPFLGGVDCLSVKYFPEPRPVPPVAREGSFFLWQRRSEVDWRVAKKLVGDARVESFNLHAACDPGVEFSEPGEEDRGRYNVTVSQWFDSKAELESLMSRYRYFFAPRGREGIGLSFLDAMALGLVVIAPDDATMNEYIDHGVNGYLYDIRDPRPIEFSDYQAVREASIRRIAEGRRKWLDSEPAIVGFIKKKHRRIAYPIDKSSVSRALGGIARAMRGDR
jgi:glycosyltransferase involved in cell wall biosynthesis